MPSKTPAPAVAFITGRHSYDVLPIQRALKSLEGLDFFFPSLEDWTADEKSRKVFKAHVFYHMFMEEPRGPGNGTPWYAGDPKKAFEQLGGGEGIVVLHHSLVAFPDWPFWAQVSGLPVRRPNDYKFDKTLTYKIEDLEHPICRGLKGWTMKDESYRLPQGPSADNHLLLSTDHPESMREIAWTRTFRKSRVFCLQSGHDSEAFSDTNFLEILRRAVLWSAGLLA